MNISKALAKYVGGELAETAGKNAAKSAVPKLSNLFSGVTAKAGEKLSTLSKVGEQLPAVAQKADDLIDADATKALKGAMSNDKAGTELATTRDNWKQAGDIEGMVGGKFLDVDENYFPNVFSEGALSRATYGADQPVDQKKVAELVKAIKNNEDIAPIAGFKNSDGLIDIYDGHHRVAAYLEAGKKPRVKLFDPSNKSEAYSYADEWDKNIAKEVKQSIPTNPRTGLDETTSMGTFPSGTKIKFGDDLGIKAVELPKEITPDKTLDKVAKYLPRKNNR